MPEPLDKTLYNQVKKEADKLFLAKTSAYKSGWIVKTYKDRGGKYTDDKPKNKGLVRWFAEKWVNINKPTKDGYEDCGRKKATHKGEYPLCRPSIKVTENTPRLISEIPKKQIIKAKKEKQKIKENGRIKY